MIAWITDHKALFVILCGNLVALLNGVLPYVPAGRALTIIGRTLSVLRWLLDLLAPTSAKDSPDTIKLPLTWSRPPDIIQHNGGPTKPEPTVPGMGRAAMVLVLLGLAVQGCCTGPQCKRDEQAVIDCTKQAVKGAGPQAKALIADVLANGLDWKADLAAIAVMLGADGKAVVDCVVAELKDAASGKPTATPETERTRQRAGEWLSDKTLRQAPQPHTELLHIQGPPRALFPESHYQELSIARPNTQAEPL